MGSGVNIEMSMLLGSQRGGSWGLVFMYSTLTGTWGQILYLYLILDPLQGDATLCLQERTSTKCISTT